jgi:predicted phosphodiesterase
MEVHVVTNDWHVPFHDKEVMRLFLSWCKENKPDVIHINGDFIDFPQISKYDKDPARILHLQDDLDKGIEIFGQIRKANPTAKIYFEDGNHEGRIKSYKWSRPELSKLRSMNVQTMLEMERFKIHYLPYGVPYIWQNKFMIYHGSIARQAAGASAKGELEKWGVSGISGHTHRGSCYSKTDAAGEKVWYENFCMCMKQKVDYIVGVPNWQHGFSVIYFNNKDKEYYVQQVPIINHRFMFNGKIFK